MRNSAERAEGILASRAVMDQRCDGGPIVVDQRVGGMQLTPVMGTGREVGFLSISNGRDCRPAVDADAE